jgi:hypothetical protein
VTAREELHRASWRAREKPRSAEETEGLGLHVIEGLTTFFAGDLAPTNPCTNRAPSGTTGARREIGIETASDVPKGMRGGTTISACEVLRSSPRNRCGDATRRGVPRPLPIGFRRTRGESWDYPGTASARTVGRTVGRRACSCWLTAGGARSREQEARFSTSACVDMMPSSQQAFRN